MTVLSTTTSVSYAGNGVTTIFAVPFKFLAAGHLGVSLVNPDLTASVPVLGVDYTVAGVGQDAGGTVTFIVPPATGKTVLITRTTPRTQDTSFRTQGKFVPTVHESALDKLMLALQDVGSIVDLNKLNITDFLVGAYAVAPRTWYATGGTGVTSFNISGASSASAEVYFVTIDGVEQDPTDYSINLTVTPAQIVFGVAPPLNSRIVVRALGYAKAVGTANDLSVVTATGSPTATDLAHRFSDIPTARNYGVKGDGSDETVALQLALNSGKVTRLPPGTYLVTGPLTVPSGGGFVADGSQTTIINYTGVGDLFTSPTPTVRTYGWVFRGFTVTTSTGNRGFFLSAVSSSNFDDVVATGWIIGWEIYSPTSGFAVYNRFRSCTGQSCGTAYYVHGTSSNATVFIGCRANLFTSIGLRILDSNDTRAIGCQFEGTTGSGVSVEASGPGLSDANTFIACRWEGAMTTGVLISTNVRGTYITDPYFVSSVVRTINDSGTMTQIVGGSSLRYSPTLSMESQIASQGDGTGIPYSLRRFANGGAGALGTNDPLLELNDEATSTGNPTSLSVKCGRLTGEYIRGTNAGNRKWNVTAQGSEWLAGGLSTASQFATPTTGQTVNINDNVMSLIIKPAGTLAALTVTMPANPDDGQLIEVLSTQTLTALTVNPNGGQTINNAPTTLAAGAGFAYKYRTTDTSWYRLY